MNMAAATCTRNLYTNDATPSKPLARDALCSLRYANRTSAIKERAGACFWRER